MLTKTINKNLRTVRLNNQSFSYTLVFKDIKNSYITLSDGKIIVSTNKNTDINEIDSFVQKNLLKIVKKMNEKDRKEVLNVQKNKISLLGEKLQLQIIYTQKSRSTFKLINNTLFLNLTKIEDKLKVVKRFYMKQAELILPKYVSAWSKVMGLTCSSLNFKWLSSKWGSCMPVPKKILLSTKLVALDSTLIDYVVVHELSHLVHDNHSYKFWAHVARYIPDYEKLQKELKYKCNE